MDSTLKRFISFITVLILCFSLSLTAEAAGTGTAENNTQKTAKKASAEKKQVTAKQVSQADNTKVKKAPEQAEAALPDDDSYLKDRALLDKLQRDTFRYMWEHTYKESGLAYVLRL